MPTVKGHHPLAEVIGKALFGIECDYPKETKRRMVNRAIKNAIEWHEEEKKKWSK